MVDKTLSLSSINFVSSLCSHFLSFHYSDRSPGQQPIRNSVLDVRLKRSRSIGSHFCNLVSKKVRKMTAAWYHLFVYAFLQSQRKFSIVFTARCSAVLGVVILSVCLSVCLSHAFLRSLWLIQRTYRRHLYTGWKAILVFWRQRSRQNSNGVTPTGAPNKGGVG